MREVIYLIGFLINISDKDHNKVFVYFVVLPNMIIDNQYRYKLPFILVCLLFANVIKAQHISNSMVDMSVLRSFDLVATNQKESGISFKDKPLSLFVFLSPECPLSQNYTSTINQLNGKFRDQVNVFGIVPGNAYTLNEVKDFENKYQTVFEIFIDTKQLLTNYLKAVVTPQAILLNNKGDIVYSGSIDDWVKALGKTKPQPTQAYLRDAIEQSLAGVPVKITRTKAFGCRINDY